MNEAYKEQVRLLLQALPEVAKEEHFAMHGGTAINLFVRDMPRLSVDIDLTYVEVNPRGEALASINAALARIKERVETLRPSLRVQHKTNTCKLQLDDSGVLIKIEVNMVTRGVLGAVEKIPLCEAAQEDFDAFCAMALVPCAQLYGGKLCAALDRQHPRDLFDIKLLLESEGLSGEIKRGLIFPQDYTASRRLGELARVGDHYGLVYPSVRDPDGGACAAVLRPPALAPPTRVSILSIAGTDTGYAQLSSCASPTTSRGEFHLAQLIHGWPNFTIPS